MPDRWHEVGPVEELRVEGVRPITAGRKRIALCYRDGGFSAISGVCNHAGGPLGEGSLDGDYVVCPWHNWKYHCRSGEGEPGFESDRVPRHEVKEEDGRLWVNLDAATRRSRAAHPAHPLDRDPVRAPGPPRVAGISTTAMDEANPRYSTSDALLEAALEGAAKRGAETRLLRLSELRFRNCEGYYSKAARACTWPCSITQMDVEDQMDRVYEAVVFWADVIVIATPIRWGNASSLYYKMAERMNCIQNQVTIRDRVLVRDKVASFIITGGQDNIQAVAGQMLTFFSELGYVFPQFPFIAHSRGWSAEDMENNVRMVQRSEELREGARSLVARALELSRVLRETSCAADPIERGGRKAHALASTHPESAPL